MSETNGCSSQPESLTERYAKAIAAVETDAATAVKMLSELQHEVAAKALFSFSSNSTSSTETMDDISTASLPLLMLEHYLAVAFTHFPTAGVEEIAVRQHNLRMACDLWTSFLQKLESLDQLNKDENAQYQDLLELSDTGNTDNMAPPANREAKIARHRIKHEAEKERQRLESLRARRGRLGVTPDEEMDGHDEEGLARSLALTNMEIAKAEALEEWASTVRELPMIAMMVRAQEERQGQGRYNHSDDAAEDRRSRDRQMQQSNGPLKVTHITQDAAGQLLFRREDIKSKVLRPGWNQPTMSLEELGDREVDAALKREERQKESEAVQKTQPRRYDQLKKDGLEDDSDLVDASAALDEKWDRFKDENPRGSGNKRGDVGDRNF